jgi:phage recombination protein Bet
MNVPALRPTRLPMPAGLDPGQWRVLTEAIFPNAKSPESVLLALDYCKARGLDVMKKPVNIVPMWNTSLGRYVETVWPSINEIQVTAARTGQWSGMEDPIWGPDVTKKFTGRKKDKGGWVDVSIEVTFPEFCKVTVYRTVGGARCPFTEPVYWLEAYGRSGGGELPNDMWAKRPRGQLQKVAKAASLRAAFPEEGELAAEEMEGATIDPNEVAPPAPKPQDAWRPPEQPLKAEPADTATAEEDFDPDTGEVGPRELAPGAEEAWREWCLRLLDQIRAATKLEEVDKWEELNADHMTTLQTEAPKVHVQLKAAIGRHRVALAQPQEAPPESGQEGTM